MGIIIPSAEGPDRPFAFGHELVRQTLLAGISAPRQQRLHAGVADAIERLYPNAINERAGDIADHLLKAGLFADERKLVHYLTLAGKRALDAAGFEEGRRSLSSALSHLTDPEPREKADLLRELAIAERGVEHLEASLINLQKAFDIYIALGDREKIATSCTELTAVSVWAGHLQEATETASRGLASLGVDFSAARASLLAVFGQLQAAAGRWEPANEALREALHIATHLSDAKLLARVLGARSIINYQFLRLKEVIDDASQSGGSEVSPW